MGNPVMFDGVNKIYAAPEDRDDVGELPVFTNGTCVVQGWLLTPEELEEINRTGTVFISTMSRGIVFPTFVGSESTVRGAVVDYGAIW